MSLFEVLREEEGFERALRVFWGVSTSFAEESFEVGVFLMRGVI